MSQETITLRTGQVQQVHILAVTPSGLRVQTANGEMVEPFANLAGLSMNPPPEYTAALAAYASGDPQRALTLITSIVSNFRGLPTDWARQAMLLQGDLNVALGQPSQAEAAYKDFQAVYPASPSDVLDVGSLGADLAHNDYSAARSKVAPLLGQALQQRNFPKAAAEEYGRAFYASGRIKEHAGDFPGALEDYLRVVAIFPQDSGAAIGAQIAADNLRKSKGVSVQ